MLSIIFWTYTEIFMQIGPWGGAKMAKRALFQSDGVLETRPAALYTSSKMTGVLETSAAALSSFMKMTGSLKQVQQHWSLFQR